jgi:uncharacterized protein (DUF885 family)
MSIVRRHAARFAAAASFIPLLWAVVPPPCSAAAPAAQQSPVQADAAFTAWSDKFAQDWVRLDPERATATQYFSGAEQDALDRQLTPLTEALRARTRALAREGVRQLDVFLAGPLGADQRVSASTMRWALADKIAGEPFEDHWFVFGQMTGVHIGLVSFMTQVHPMRRAADVDSYLARLDQVALRIDEAIARGRAAAARKLLPPRVILERAQVQVDSFLQAPAAENVFVSALAKRSASIADLTPEARAAAIARATAIVSGKILPAYGRVKTFMADIHPDTPLAVGLSNLPDGAAAYRHDVASFTSTAMTPEQIHAIGLREVARIEGEMDKHLRTLGYTDGTVNERMAKLDASLQPANQPDPRPALLARYTAAVRDGEARSRSLFNLVPRAPVEVRREPPLTEQSASAHYTMPAPDGSRPGIFWAPLPGPPYEIVRIRGTAYHEAVPGHHFQLALQQEQASLPKFRAARIFGGGSAHSEGWGLYAERLAIDNGWYDGDVPSLLGALDLQLFRARRLVVDTGMHAKGWTREQAIAYGMTAQEIERYISVPGQANAYMIGMLRIMELRDMAMHELGPRFSLQAFHDVVLRTGSVPLEVLTEVVKGWVNRGGKP